MPPPIEARIQTARRWLASRRGKGALHRAVYLVPGLTDERGGCWETFTQLGREVFPEWDRFATIVTIPGDGVFPPTSARAGESMGTFWDIGEFVRERIAERHPERGSGVGEYDVVCHSMGGLDALVALVATNHPVAMAYNFITYDSPFRGIPNADLMKLFPNLTERQKSQANAIGEGTADLARLLAKVPELIDRVERITCLRASTTIYVAVPPSSADLLGQDDAFPTRDDRMRARKEVGYRFLGVPGSVHSGQDGLTKVRIGVVEVFRTLMGEV